MDSLVNKILVGKNIRKVLLEEDLDNSDVDAVANVIEQLIDYTLHLLGLTLSNAHLSDKYSEFRKKFEAILRREKLDLSFKSVVTKKYGIKIGGNADGITADVSYFIWSSPWKDVEMTKPEIVEYLKKHKNAKCFVEYNKPYMNSYGRGGTVYSGVREVDKDIIINSQYGTEVKDIGIGSQASTHITKVSLKKDKAGNLLLSRSLEVWD